MSEKKKLQVFISSTYSDLKEERQAAVEAILTAGHIPAGMELFAAGDESQMNVIKRWIDESDVYLLILGGRYGSIEPRSQKSYIQLEYEYAVSISKPLFAVVVEDGCLNQRVKRFGTKVIETDNPQKLRKFRTQVLTRMVKFWGDPRDIKLSIMETMAEFSRRADLTGWVPSNESVRAESLAAEIARLAKENGELREHVKKLSTASTTYDGLTFEEFYGLLAATKVERYEIPEEGMQALSRIANVFGDLDSGILHVFWMYSEGFRRKATIPYGDKCGLLCASKFEELGLIELDMVGITGLGKSYQLTENGKQFLIRLKLERDVEKAEEFLIDLV